MLYENDDRVKELNSQKNSAIDGANSVYDRLIEDNKAITEQNERYLDEYYDTNVDLANRQNQLNLDLINQQQEQAQKTYKQNMRDINSTYQKSINPYGVNAEVSASQGMQNTGYIEATNMNKFSATQKQLAQTRSSNEQAYQEFENQKSKARLEHDSTIAQYGLDVLKQKLDAQLKEFQYNSDLTLDRLKTTQDLENDYYSRYLDIVNQLNWEQEQAESKRQFNEELSYRKSQDKVSNDLAEKYYQLSKRYG